MLRFASALIGVLGWCAVAQAQTAPASDIQPGTYVLEIAFGGGVLDGTLVLSTAGDSLAVKLNVGDHVSPVRIGSRQGTRLVLEGSGGMQIRYQLDFKGDAVTGSFTYEGDVGTVTGRRRAGG